MLTIGAFEINVEGLREISGSFLKDKSNYCVDQPLLGKETQREAINLNIT